MDEITELEAFIDWYYSETMETHTGSPQHSSSNPNKQKKKDSTDDLWTTDIEVSVLASIDQKNYTS